MTIARVIEGRSATIFSTTTTTSVRDAVAQLASRRIGALPVFDGAGVAGIFSERDVIHHLAERGPGILDALVGDVMTAPAISVAPDTGVLEALGLMTRRRVRHLPVLSDGKFVAFISIGDLVKYRIDHISSEAEALRSYIQMA
jgi:CBS domain-containing protein